MKISKIPNQESITTLLKSAEDIISIHDDAFVKDYLKYHHRRLALDYEWITENVDRNSRMLEIGGFPFFLTDALIKKGFALEVVDKMSELAALLVSRHGLVVKSCDIETDKLPYADGEFDEIIFNEIFEHLRINPIFTLREIFRILKPGGRLWLSTPNLGSLKGISNLVVRNEAWSVVGEGVFEQYRYLEKLGWMGHVREYTSKEVADFLQAIGFDKMEVIYRGEYVNTLAKMFSVLNPRLLPYFTCIVVKPQDNNNLQ